MSALVSFCFDVVAWLSALLNGVFLPLARGDSDLAAMLVCASCLVIVCVCHDFFVGSGSRFDMRKLAKRILIALLVFVGTLHIGTQVTKLPPSKIKRSEGLAFRVSLPEKEVGQLEASQWLVISSKSAFSPKRWLLADPWMQRAPSVTLIENYGGGAWRMRSRNLYFSSPDGSDATRDGVTYRIVRERAWLPRVRGAVCVFCLFVSLAMLIRRVGPGLRSAWQVSWREKLLLSCLLAFAVYFGAHQSRFLPQDDRQQRISSRFDDGYMLERLFQAAELKTMDPLRLDNKAYGAIGFYPFAILPYAASHFGLRPNLEWLNATVRGLKLVFSLGALAAVWLLGARHFSKGVGVAAFVLLATNLGFLSYSSFPFYPDVLMAGLSTMSLVFLLDLVSRWSPRSFFATVAFAALSVSVKFLTFLLFPFIFVVSAVALWRVYRHQRQSFWRELLRNWTLAGVLCVAVFFVCNPYLRYNVEWMVPNYKMCGSYYSAETPNFVAGARATFSTWLSTSYSAGRDMVEIVSLIVAALAGTFVLLRLTLSCAARGHERFRWPGGVLSSATVIILVGTVFQLYLLRSMTLAESIDQRLVLPLYPLIYLIAAWCVLSGINSLPVRSQKTAAILCAAGVAGFAVPRLQNVGDFYRLFGQAPTSTPVSTWLAAADVPAESWIVNGLQSYIPSLYKDVSAGMWLPKDVNHVIRRMGALPTVYIEDESGFEANFSSAVRDRGINSTIQQKLHEDGARIYGALHRGEFGPYEIAAWGEEPVGLNAIVHTSRKFRLYANPLAFATNLATQSELKLSSRGREVPVTTLPSSAAGSLVMRWNQPITAGAIHITTIKKPCPPLQARLERLDGTSVTIPIPAIGSPDPDVTQRIASLNPALDIRSLTLLGEDGTLYGADQIAAVRVHPPVPFALNTTRFFFDPMDGSNANALKELMAWRPSETATVKVEPSHPLTFQLARKVSCGVSAVSLVLDDAPAGDVRTDCTFHFADGTQHAVDANESRSLLPPHVYFQVACPDGKPVERIECRVTSRRGAKLRQVHVQARLTEGATRMQ